MPGAIIKMNLWTWGQQIIQKAAGFIWRRDRKGKRRNDDLLRLLRFYLEAKTGTI